MVASYVLIKGVKKMKELVLELCCPDCSQHMVAECFSGPFSSAKNKQTNKKGKRANDNMLNSLLRFGDLPLLYLRNHAVK